MATQGPARLLLILGNQLFAPAHLRSAGAGRVFMAEDHGLCTYACHHKLKLVLFLAAMRSHADTLRDAGLRVHYARLDDQPAGGDAPSYEQKLADYLDDHPEVQTLVHYEVEDKFFEHRLASFAGRHGLDRDILPSPMFLTPRQVFADYLDDAGGKPFMARFYEQQRRRLGILLDDTGGPVGGQWSFDADNRKKLPRGVALPGMPEPTTTDHVRAVVPLVNERFPDHPGRIEHLRDVWFPTTRRQALAWLGRFLEQRFKLFGDYEDALSARGDFLFHSALTPSLNLGLITPDEVIDRALEHARQHDTPINSVEGFVRQVIGWREFVRGIYQHYSEKQERSNSFGHHRQLTAKWWTGETGLPPLDDAIRKALRLGYTHHIERLMVLCNFMNLCEVEPRAAHDWFMAMFIDASDWVMGPNVYGMGLRSDGGIFSTKPYLCGSNYLRKMGDYGKGDWCDLADGLYWRFIDKHRDFFEANARMAVMPRSLDKLKPDRKMKIFGLAQSFIEDVTEAP
ncbi:MAG: cryptochrome/photolyase family protein [Phycisphaerales bacterium JB063]